MITFSFETITPQDAARILREHDEAVANGEIINRPRKPNAIKRYSADMQIDQWNPETAETIKFETQERPLIGRHLVDGQNRLHACEVPGVPFRVYVARGVARESFAYIDGGERRSLRDVLRISGEPDAMALTPALKWLCQWDSENRRITSAIVTTQRARRLLESDPAIRKSVTKAKVVKESGLLGVGLAGFLHRIFSKHDPKLADRFIDVIATGAGLESDDPFLLLRQRLIENKGSRKKHPQKDLIALAIKAWNAKRAGRKVKLLRYNHRSEDMPILEPAIAEREDADGRTSSGTEKHANA
jgi:hypothetical protein